MEIIIHSIWACVILIITVLAYIEFYNRRKKKLQEIAKYLNVLNNDTLRLKDFKAVIKQQNINTELLQKIESEMNNLKMRVGFNLNGKRAKS